MAAQSARQKATYGNVNAAAGTVSPIPLLDPRRTFIAALVLASKFSQNKSYSNHAWTKLAGLPPREIGRCERALGYALGWRLWVGKASAQIQQQRPLSRATTEPDLSAMAGIGSGADDANAHADADREPGTGARACARPQHAINVDDELGEHGVPRWRADVRPECQSERERTQRGLRHCVSTPRSTPGLAPPPYGYAISKEDLALRDWPSSQWGIPY
ncbi:unnamed protein product [Peniophora sp. CBMAI 1063]|nr:unnamed protein product [Peniophora sp. CBMAI 1063]